MAEDKSAKTEKASPRRLKEAKERGQVVRSPELVPWTLVLTATFVLPAVVSRGHVVVRERLMSIRSAAVAPDEAAALGSARGVLDDVMTLLLPVLLAVAVLSLVLNVSQTGPLLSIKALKPNMKKLNPATGLKRIVSARGQWEAAKAAMRLFAVMIVSIPLVMGVARDVAGRPQFDLGQSIPYLGERLLQLGRTVALLGLLITVADFAMQRRNHARDLRMTKQEVKQENRQTDGDPLLKRRIRSAQQEISRNRMLSSVAGASVIVVNPTHFSVAIRYDEAVGVPVVVAKGAGSAALRIRAEGLEASIPVVECKPLARALYRTCAVGGTVPKDLFQGVAILLAFVYRLGRRRTYGGIHELDVDLSVLGLAERSTDANGAERPNPTNGDQPTMAATTDGSVAE